MFETLRSDPDATNWLVISLLGFWLRYPEAIGAGSATVPEHLYHVDNFYVRVHKLIENVYRLLGQLVDLDPRRTPIPGEPSFRKQVRDGLNEQKLQPITEILGTFEENEWIKKAVKARNLFVHQYRQEPEWPMLSPEARLREPAGDEDPLASEVRRIDQATDLDRYAARKVDELSRSLEPIRVFCEQIFHILLDKLEERAPTP